MSKTPCSKKKGLLKPGSSGKKLSLNKHEKTEAHSFGSWLIKRSKQSRYLKMQLQLDRKVSKKYMT